MVKAGNVLEAINDFATLKQYCCPRVAYLKEWYMQCVDCGNRDGCACGMRAVELLEKETSVNTHVNDYTLSLIERARSEYETALQQDDPIGWVMKEHNLMNRTKASNQLGKWRKKYPDICQKYNHVSLANKNVKTQNSIRTEKAREKYEMALQQEDPIDWLMKNNPIVTTRSNASIRLAQWRKSYPDIFEKYGSRSLQRNRKAKSKERDEEKMAKSSEEELSVSDFINEVADTLPKVSLTINREDLTAIGEEEDGDEYDPLLDAVQKRKEIILKDIAILEEEIAVKKNDLETLNRAYYILTGKVPE